MRYVECVLKQYPDKVTILILKAPIMEGKDNAKLKHYNQGDYTQDFLEKSINRTHRVVRDYILCNNFTYFFTLTISPKVCDRLDDITVQKELKKYLDNIRRHNSLEYIIVPERHKNGALHFHGLTSTPQAFNLKPSNMRDKSGRTIFLSQNYKLGRNNFTEISSKVAVSQYVRKYISKQFHLNDPYKKRYWCSKNLKKPDVHYLDIKDLPDGLWDMMTDLDYAYYGEFGV